MNRLLSPVPILLALTTASLTSLSGCGGSTAKQTDESAGRQLLITFLDTWKDGKSIDSLKSKMVARDPDWAAGKKLAAYTIEEPIEISGYDLLANVKLSLVEADGSKRDRKVKFKIGIGSQQVVLRSNE